MKTTTKEQAITWTQLSRLPAPFYCKALNRWLVAWGDFCVTPSLAISYALHHSNKYKIASNRILEAIDDCQTAVCKDGANVARGNASSFHRFVRDTMQQHHSDVSPKEIFRWFKICL